MSIDSIDKRQTTESGKGVWRSVMIFYIDRREKSTPCSDRIFLGNVGEKLTTGAMRPAERFEEGTIPLEPVRAKGAVENKA